MTTRPDPSLDRQIIDRLSEAEQELDSLRAQLEHANRLATLGVLAAGVAHEINNVLTPVLGYAQLTCNHPDDEDLREKAAERIAGGVEAAVRIARAMLDFSTVNDEPAAANVAEVLQSSLDCLARHPEKDGITLTCQVPPLAAVQMRPVALQQVLLNLMMNAIRALRQGDGRNARLEIAAAEQADGSTLVRVSDTGPGIPEAIADRLFEPFVTWSPEKVDPETVTGGAGLGLAVCRQLVEAAGGTISASSRPGRGTEFSVVLPTDTSRQLQSRAG